MDRCLEGSTSFVDEKGDKVMVDIEAVYVLLLELLQLFLGVFVETLLV